MSIMVAGGLTIAAPSFAPEAAADERLMYISCENEMFGNTFGGGQICEVIIRDPARDETDEVQSEPEVEVDSNTLRMVQGDDGYWYGYFGSTDEISALHVGNANFVYGVGQSSGSGPSTGAVSNNVATGHGTGNITVASNAQIWVAHGNSKTNTQTASMSLVDGHPDLSDYASKTSGYAGFDATLSQAGQHNITSYMWPFIQTWNFANDDTVEVEFEKPGANEYVELIYGGDDTEDFAYIELARNTSPMDADVPMTIYDQHLNIDPTVEDTIIFLTNGSYGISYNSSATFADFYSNGGFGDNGKLIIDYDASSSGTPVLNSDITLDSVSGLQSNSASGYHVFWESASNSGIFTNVDDADDASLDTSASALRGTTATIDYNDSAQSLVVTNFGGSIDMAGEEAGEEWNSGEPITVTLVDEDRNKNPNSDEDLTVSASTNVPTITMGDAISPVENTHYANVTIQDCDGISGICLIAEHLDTAITTYTNSPIWQVELGVTVGSVGDGLTGSSATLNGMNASLAQKYIGYDVSSFCQADSVQIGAATSQANKGVVSYGTAEYSATEDDFHCIVKSTIGSTFTTANTTYPFAVNYMAFGMNDNHGKYHVEVEETDDNTGVFVGAVEFIMVNNNTIDADLSATLTPIDDEVTMLMTADETGTDAPRIKYNDTDADGVFTGIADQVDAPTHSGVVTLDSESYKVADTITITVTDMDLNSDSELIDVYITQADDLVGDGDTFDHTTGDSGASNSHILDVYFGDKLFDDTCDADYGLTAQGFQLTETGIASGVFTGTFQIPSEYCGGASNAVKTSTTGEDIFVNYNDLKDVGGNEIEVGAAATVSANSGSVALDRSVYPVPFTWSQFMAHDDAYISGNDGNVTITVAVTDADYDTSPSGEDTIPAGKVIIKAVRGSTTGTLLSNFALVETEATSGVFDHEFQINGTVFSSLGNTALRQGDVITAEYTDPTDASGNSYLVTDSSTLDLRTGSLLSDKSVYVIGSDAIITIVDADLNLDSDSVESYTLGLVEWDSDAGIVNLNDSNTGFDAEPSAFRETGSDTGIFQTVIEMPGTVGSSSTVVDQGEQIDLEYVDYGPSGENNYNDDTEDIELTIYTSNFGATIELDSKVYTWSDRVFVTIVAPDHNTDSALVDEIGGSGKTLTAQTRESKLTAYKMVETGPDTGIFWGEITLIGFAHDSDGDGTNDGPFGTQAASAAGPTDGLLKSSESDGVTVSFEYTEDSTVVSSSLIRWNIGEVSYDEDSYLSSSSAIVSVVDPDMNTNPDSVENFKVDVYSDSDSGGIELTVTETNESTGVFEGTVFFTSDDASSGHTLRVSEGDSITAEYSDHTLPEPYSTSDDIDVSSTAVIGTQTPPLERAPVANARVVDAFGNSLAEVSVDQQVQIEADLTNGQDDSQSFAYLVQVQDGDGVTVSLAWITGSLAAGQSLSPALSWIPDASGTYEATVFVWESVDNPTALSDTTSVTIQVV
jgi:hypothetical protein